MFECLYDLTTKVPEVRDLADDYSRVWIYTLLFIHYPLIFELEPKIAQKVWTFAKEASWYHLQISIALFGQIRTVLRCLGNHEPFETDLKLFSEVFQRSF